jgi:SAM-dependent methyltransferase
MGNWLKPRSKQEVIAFGVEPSNRKFRLRLARYVGIADLLAGLKLREGALVLDAGCGRGRMPLYYKARPGVPPVTFIGVDVSDERIKDARVKGSYAEIIKSGIETLPFETGSFDVIVCEQVLEHLDDAALESALSEFNRVLRPDGRLIAGVPVYTDPELWIKPIWLGARAVLAKITGSTPDHEQQFSVRTFKKLLRRHGFAVEGVRAYRLWSLFYQWLEDDEWYYRMQGRLAQRFPALSGEVDMLCRREAVEAPSPAPAPAHPPT